MRVLIIDVHKNTGIYDLPVLPRIGDRVLWEYDPPPIVDEVIHHLNGNDHIVATVILK